MFLLLILFSLKFLTAKISVFILSFNLAEYIYILENEKFFVVVVSADGQLTTFCIKYFLYIFINKYTLNISQVLQKLTSFTFY